MHMDARQDKNHWIALYLTGKHPGHFRTPDKLLFIDSLKVVSPTEFSDEKIKLLAMFGQVDEYEFYLSHIAKVEREFPGKLGAFMSSLGIPDEIRGDEVSFFDRKALLEDFELVRADSNTTTKGEAFEVFLKKFFASIPGLEVLNIEQASDEQIDLIIKNNVDRPFWMHLNSPILLGEAKNWSKNTPTAVLHELRGKMDGHRNFSKIGIVIALNGFTKEAEKNQARDGAGEKIMIKITGADIADLLSGASDPLDWLETRIVDAFR